MDHHLWLHRAVTGEQLDDGVGELGRERHAPFRLVRRRTASMIPSPSSPGTFRQITIDPSASTVVHTRRSSCWWATSAGLTRRNARTSRSMCAAVPASARSNHSCSVSAAGDPGHLADLAPRQRSVAQAAWIFGNERSFTAARMCSEAATFPSPHFHDSHCDGDTHPHASHPRRSTNSPNAPRNCAFAADSRAAHDTNNASTRSIDNADHSPDQIRPPLLHQPCRRE